MLPKRIHLLFAVVTAAALLLLPSVRAQVVTSGLTGLVRDTTGKPIGNASITAVHVPTNTTFKTTTSSSGQYNLRSLQVGGPYTVTATADGYHDGTITGVETQLGQDVDANITIGSDVVELEKLVVTEDRNSLDSTAAGSSTLLTAARLAAKPTTQRSLADLVSATPGITLRAVSGDREEAMITAVGQNNRFNSVMIDGNRINDQFGLNATGLASFFNPLSLDTIDQLSIQISPYDTRYSGFTGASINAVTKSGTNVFKGSAYYIWSGDHLAGLQFQGQDERKFVQTGVKSVPKLERTTRGLTFGGPIWKNHVFFFLNWEKFDRISPPTPSGLASVAPVDLAAINARVAAITKVNFGSLGGTSSVKAADEKKLLKVDWNITNEQRLSLRYSSTDGEIPQFGDFSTTAKGSGLNNNSALGNLLGGAVTAFDSHFYSQLRKEKSLSAQLFSTWTSDLKTELKWSRVKQDQYTPTNSIAPQIDIYNVNGVSQAGVPVSSGVVELGTERFRHGNQLNVDTKNYSAIAEYSRGNYTFSGGFDMENNEYANLFRQFSYGVFNYASVADFVADTPRFFQRNFTDLALKGGYSEASQYTQTGAFAQVKVDYTSRLKFQFGVRYDWSSSDSKPVFNPQFLADTGMRNDGTVDGARDVSPRAGFNWALDEARNTQVRGGVGYFVGRAPWVFWSNSYGNTGLGTYTVTTLPTGGLNGYLANNFDPASPYGTGTQTGFSRSEIDLADNRMHMPSLWRMNLAVDQKLSFLSSVLSVEVIHSTNDNSLYVVNDNLKVKGYAADGRVYYASTGATGTTFGPANLANAKFANYTNIYHLKNIKAGESTYATVSWDRAMKDHWAFDVAYTRGKARDAQSNNATTAPGMWQRNMVFNQDAGEVGRSDFEVKDRLQVGIAREIELVKRFKTTTSLYYEGRSGNPYSFAYSTDFNQDGQAANDLIAVPSDVNDSRFDFSALSTTQRDAMFAFIQGSGLSKYGGGYAPKNAFYQPWVNRLDLSLKQSIPLHAKTTKLDLILDFTNFGSFLSRSLFNYVERAPTGPAQDLFERRLVGNAQIDNATGKIKPTTWAPADFLVDDTMSRWRIQLTARLSF
ncbi:MAG: TonB-dependent receptor [Opitutus sp.]